MHSSRMRTARLLTISCNMGGVRLGGVCLGGALCLGGICLVGCLPRECLPRGVCPGGVLIVDRMTDMCKNITLPQMPFAGGN